MSPQASEVTSQDIAPRIRALPSQPVDVLLALGVAAWGPLEAQVVTDYDDFVQKYRGFLLGYELPLQIRQFFLEGGRKAYIGRVVHVSGVGVPVTAAKSTKTIQTAASGVTNGSVTGSVVGPFVLTPGDTLVGSVDGLANQTATFSAAAASLECANAETYVLADLQTLTVKINGGSVQTITFNTAEFVSIAAATAEEVAAVINAEIVGATATVTSGGTKVTITSDRKGTSSGVEVTGGSGNAALGFSTAPVAGTGNVANIEAVTVAEVETIVEAAWTNGGGVAVTSSSGAVKITAGTAGPTGSVLVVASSTADDELGLDNATHSGTSGAAVNTLKFDGRYYGGTIGNALSIVVEAASNANAEYFNIRVLLNGVQDEPTYQNLTMDDTSVDYVETKFNTGNRSWLVEATDLAASGTATQRRPANGTYTMTGGDDGLASLDDNDFSGSIVYGTGLHQFDVLEEGDLLISPDRKTTTHQNSAMLYCEEDKRRTVVFIPDVPAGLTKESAATHQGSLTPSEQSLPVYWPQVKIPNPDKALYGQDATITIAASGSAAGVMARNTRAYETHIGTQPGNQIYGRMLTVSDVADEEVKKISVRRYLASNRINPIFAGKDIEGAYGVWLDDVMASKTTGNWKSVGEIRLLSKIRKDVMAYMETIRTTPNTEDNRLNDQIVLGAYMIQWVSRKVLASMNASEAFYINTDPKGVGINNPLVQEAEEYNVVIAVATARSRRLIHTFFTRDQRAIENYIQQQLTSP